MTCREYRFLKKLYNASKEIDDNQKYKSHFVDDVARIIGLDKVDVLAIAKKLGMENYVSLIKNREDCGGYIHCISITYSGVSAMRHYYENIILKVFWSILMPAVISLICSLIIA
ncbi:MAG TPA: hypothetical protein VFC70_05395 [Oscillospiraceae bacterium]|nr:hypothetical protein [Oscillospiraceae bacterium]